MYLQLLAYLFQIIKYQHQIIILLLTIILGRSVEQAKPEQPINKEYRKLIVDELPVIQVLEKASFQDIKQAYFSKTGKELKPVRRHANTKVQVPENLCCPKCSAPSAYLYANNGASGQYRCKACDCLFNQQSRYQKEAIFRCPHCLKALEKIKERKEFHVWKCKRDDCSYYQQRKNGLTKAEKIQFKQDPQAFKLRYVYREFLFDFQPLSPVSPVKPRVDLSCLHTSPHTLGLILTYHVNYGISARKTAAMMRDIHQVSISHQTILNYMNSVALIMKPFVDRYPYELSDQFCGDETYIRVNGKWHYLFFFFDATKKIILSYRTSPNRDTLSAIHAIDDVLQKFKQLPEHLNLIVDGNPIYLLAQHYFAQHGISFDVTRVIGLTNEDPVSTEYRPLKQVIERLNRTFKGHYRAITGFGSQAGAVTFVTLFTAYFNFLRPHASLESNVPVMIPELEKMPHMPARWTKLLSLAQRELTK